MKGRICDDTEEHVQTLAVDDSTLKPPASVLKYCREFGETPENVRQSLYTWVGFFNELQETNRDLGQWIAFKLSTTRLGANQAMRWAGIDIVTGQKRERR